MKSDFIAPQLATPREQVPEGSEWIHEIKWDGYRMLTYIDASGRRLISRNGLDWSARFPEVTAALRSIKAKDAVLDGEIVALDEHGRSDFSRLQAMIERGQRVALTYVLFDLLRANGEDIRSKPLRVRKARLAKMLPTRHPVLQFAEHIEGSGVPFFVQACESRLEGIISKLADAPYVSGRTTSWIKVKCIDAKEFAVGGFVRSERRNYFKSLIVGESTEDGLVYRGQVGGGFTEALGHKVAGLLKPLETSVSPFAEIPWELRNKAKWVRPEYVVTVRFTEITRDGVLRHPRFVRIRHISEPGVGEHLRSRTIGDIKRKPRRIKPKPHQPPAAEALTKVLRRAAKPQRHRSAARVGSKRQAHRSHVR